MFGAKLHPTHTKKLLGQFYTPIEAAKILSSWAIRTSHDRILEPSFGACGFLEATLESLNKLGAEDPKANLFGCDIDRNAFDNYLFPKIGITEGSKAKFIHDDFLKLKPTDFSNELFDVVIGNPPYVSYHNMTITTRQLAEKAIAYDGFSLSAKSSLWAYFVLHAIPFVQIGGRMAWIMPSSFLHADYAELTRNYIGQHFEDVLVVQLGQRLFLDEGTEEVSTIVLADRKLATPKQVGNIYYHFAPTLDDLETAVKLWSPQHKTNVPQKFADSLKDSLLSSMAKNCLLRIESQTWHSSLKDIAKVHIGIVTGDNSFFVISENIASQHGLLNEKLLTHIFPKFSIASGIELTDDDFVTARENKQLCCLFIDTNCEAINRKNSALRKYLATMPRSKRKSIRTFQKRPLWHRPDDGNMPDAFMPYMHHAGPRLVINHAEVNSTNTIHRVYFKRDIPFPQISFSTWLMACAISMLSTYSQLSAEFTGRSYGSGVLKHELAEAGRIKLALPSQFNEQEVDDTFRKIDEALRANRLSEARTYADTFILKEFSNTERIQIISQLNQVLEKARLRRMRYDQFQKLQGK